MENKYVIWFFLALAIIFIVAEAARYVINKKKIKPTEVGLNEPNQKYVLKNLKEFGVSNKGTSLDEKTIYLVDYDKLGL